MQRAVLAGGNPPNHYEILRKVWRAEAKLVDGIRGYREGVRTNNAEAAAQGCRKVLDALAEMADAVLLEHGVRPYWGQSSRSTRRSTLLKMELLRRGGLILAGRGDIEVLYAHAKSDLGVPRELMVGNPGDVVLNHAMSGVTRVINSESRRLRAKYGKKRGGDSWAPKMKPRRKQP